MELNLNKNSFKKMFFMPTAIGYFIKWFVHFINCNYNKIMSIDFYHSKYHSRSCSLHSSFEYVKVLHCFRCEKRKICVKQRMDEFIYFWNFGVHFSFDCLSPPPTHTHNVFINIHGTPWFLIQISESL